MAVYVVEIPNEASVPKEEIESIIVDAFEGVEVKVQHKHRGTLKDLAWEEECNVYMGAG